MRSKLLFIALVIAVAFAATYFVTNYSNKTSSSVINRLEKKVFYDSLKIAKQDRFILELSYTVDSLESDFDTIEIERIVYRDRFNKIKAEEVINDESVDSTCRFLLSDCVDLNEINEQAITKLKAINIKQDELINSQFEQLDNSFEQNKNKDKLLIAYRTENEVLYKKLNRRTKQRNLTWIAVATIVVVSVVFK